MALGREACAAFGGDASLHRLSSLLSLIEERRASWAVTDRRRAAHAASAGPAEELWRDAEDAAPWSTALDGREEGGRSSGEGLTDNLGGLPCGLGLPPPLEGEAYAKLCTVSGSARSLPSALLSPKVARHGPMDDRRASCPEQDPRRVVTARAASAAPAEAVVEPATAEDDAAMWWGAIDARPEGCCSNVVAAAAARYDDFGRPPVAAAARYDDFGRAADDFPRCSSGGVPPAFVILLLLRLSAGSCSAFGCSFAGTCSRSPFSSACSDSLISSSESLTRSPPPSLSLPRTTASAALFTSAAGLGLLGKVGIIAVCALDSHIYILYRARGPWRCGIIMGTVPPRSGSALRETARVQSPETRADPRSQTRVEISTPDARRSAGPRATRRREQTEPGLDREPPVRTVSVSHMVSKN